MVKKQDRFERAEQRSAQLDAVSNQDNSVDKFIDECRKAMASSDFHRFHSEATASAGDSFHIFDMMIYALAQTGTAITPGLRKAIDSVIDSYNSDRSRISSLSSLQYSDFWKRQYGYH